MRTAGIISEYNPFHRGHAWQIGELRRRLGAETAVVCAMSGSFVQRGDFAVMRTHARAEAAVRGIEAQMEAAQADYVELQRLTQEREQAQAALDALTERWVYLHDLHEHMEAEQRNG